MVSFSFLHMGSGTLCKLQESKVDVPVFCLYCLCYVTISDLFLGFDIILHPLSARDQGNLLVLRPIALGILHPLAHQNDCHQKRCM